MGSIWEGSGSVCGVSWALLGPSWPFFGRSKASFFKALIQDRLQEAFCIDFGSILGGFWQGLTKDLGAFGSFWARIWKPSWTLLGGFFGNPGALLVVSEASLGSLGYFGYVLGYVVVPGKVQRRALERIWKPMGRDLQRRWNFEIDVLELLRPLLDGTFS